MDKENFTRLTDKYNPNPREITEKQKEESSPTFNVDTNQGPSLTPVDNPSYLSFNYPPLHRINEGSIKAPKIIPNYFNYPPLHRINEGSIKAPKIIPNYRINDERNNKKQTLNPKNNQLNEEFRRIETMQDNFSNTSRPNHSYYNSQTFSKCNNNYYEDHRNHHNFNKGQPNLSHNFNSRIPQDGPRLSLKRFPMNNTSRFQHVERHDHHNNLVNQRNIPNNLNANTQNVEHRPLHFSNNFQQNFQYTSPNFQYLNTPTSSSLNFQCPSLTYSNQNFTNDTPTIFNPLDVPNEYDLSVIPPICNESNNEYYDNLSRTFTTRRAERDTTNKLEPSKSTGRDDNDRNSWKKNEPRVSPESNKRNVRSKSTDLQLRNRSAAHRRHTVDGERKLTPEKETIAFPMKSLSNSRKEGAIQVIQNQDEGKLSKINKTRIEIISDYKIAPFRLLKENVKGKQHTSSSVKEDNDDETQLPTAFEDHEEDNEGLKHNLRSTRSSGKIEEASILEDPVESLGERIKIRKALKKPRKNELDKLHEDIRATMGDGVLILQRACKLNKNCPEDKKSKKLTELSNESICKKSRNVRVISEKLVHFDIPNQNSVVKVEITKRKSLPRTSKLTRCYTEADEMQKLEHEVHFERREEKETKVIDETEKKKTLNRKKCAWSLDVIKKKERITKTDAGQVGECDEFEVEEQNIEGAKGDSVVVIDDEDGEDNEGDEDDDEDIEFVEPNSNYYYLAGAVNKCELCYYQGKEITQHYISTHPRNEIWVSKLPPNETKEAVEESERLNLDELEPFNEISRSNWRKRFDFICRFCKNRLRATAINFHDHLTQHTGEMRFKCTDCNYKSQSKKNFTKHNQSVHKNEAELLTDPTPINFRYVFGYVCSECNFLQLERKTIVDHIMIYHLENNVRPIRINMSYFIEDDINKSKTINASADEGTENTTSEIKDAKEYTPTNSNDKFIEIMDEEDINDVPGVVNKKTSIEVKNLTGKLTSNVTRKIEYNSTTSKVDQNEIDLETLEDIPDNTSKASQNSELFDNDVKSTKQSISKKNRRLKRSTSWSPKNRKVLKVAKSDQIVEEELKRQHGVNGTKNSSSNSATKNQDNNTVLDFTAFIDGKDIVGQELSLDHVRLGQMEEIENNKIISKRTSFINELKTQLENEIKEKSPAPIPTLLKPKIEPPDYMEEDYKIFEDDSRTLMEDNVNLNIHMEVLKETNETAKELYETFKDNKTPEQAPAKPTPLIQLNDIKRELPASPPSLVEYVSEKNTMLNIVSRLREHLNKRMIPRVLVLDNGNRLYSVGAIDAQVSKSGVIIYYCRRTDCIFNTEVKRVFETHCKLTHKYDLLQLTCQVCVEKQPEKQDMITIFNHLCKHIEEGLCNEAQDFSLEKDPESFSSTPPGLKFKISNVTSLATKKDNAVLPLVPIVQDSDQRLILISPSGKTKEVSKKPLILNQLLPTNLNQPLSNIEEVQTGNTMITYKTVPIRKSEVNIPRKHPNILKAWLNPILLNRLLKCPFFNCTFTAHAEEDFDSHLRNHDYNVLQSCIYCNHKMMPEFIKVHYMVRHAKSSYGCGYCLYRSVSANYIRIHQESMHKFKPPKVLDLKVEQFSTVYKSPNPPCMKNIMKPYICFCGKKFYAISIFEMHLSKCGEPFRCNLCRKMFLKPTSLIQHFQIHKVFAYNCRYCAFGAPTSELILEHIVAEHPYQKVNIIWRNLKDGYSAKDYNEEEDSVFDNFIVTSSSNRDEILNTPSTSSINTEIIVNDYDDQQKEISKTDIENEKKDKETITESFNENPQNTMNKTDIYNDKIEEDSFSPYEINLLSVRPIFSQNVYCSICKFGTKVRSNLVRHLQLHKNNEDAEIPVLCPVNPIPCLEKNEMMFDKMTNLAKSSYSSMSRSNLLKSKDDEIYCDVPAHIPNVSELADESFDKNLLNTSADQLIERRIQSDISLLNEDRTTNKEINLSKGFSNLDFCIDAVATGTEVCASPASAKAPTRRGRKRKSDEQQLQTFKFINNNESPPILFKAEPPQTDSVINVDDTSPINTIKIIKPATNIYYPTKSDLESMTIDKLINNNFMGSYGPFGKPQGNLFQCPLCENYKTKELAAFEIHLMEELSYKRFTCDICQFNSAVTYAQMRTHYNETHGSIQPDNISSILRDEGISNWIQNVILLQNRLILNFNKNENDVDVDDASANFFNRSSDMTRTYYDGESSSKSLRKTNEETSEMDITNFCNDKMQSNLKEFMVRPHAIKIKYQCSYCSYSSVLKENCMKHVRNVHETKPDHGIFNKSDLSSSKSKVNSENYNDSSKMKQTARKSTSKGILLQKHT